METAVAFANKQVEEALKFIRKHINVRFRIGGKAQREEVWDYPPEALREAVINAVAHRDYAEPDEVQIKILDDRIIFWNPGGLPFELKVEDLYKPHPSKPRNKLIAKVFYYSGHIEKWGSGIGRILKALREYNLPEPGLRRFLEDSRLHSTGTFTKRSA